MTIQKCDWVSNNAKPNANGWSAPLTPLSRASDITLTNIVMISCYDVIESYKQTLNRPAGGPICTKRLHNLQITVIVLFTVCHVAFQY